jgi:glycosyltransferase involved in cell wall biosynthesis
MGKAPRLLYVVNEAGFFLSHRLPLALAAAQAGYDVHVATPDAPDAAAIREAGLTFHPVPFSRKGTHPLTELASLHSLYRLYRSLRPDLAHHVTIKPVLYGGIVARVTRIPAVVSAISGLGHVFIAKGWKAMALRTLVRRVYKIALGHPNSKVIFQNPDDQRAFGTARLIRPESAVLIRGAGVDLARFAPVPQPAGEPLVLFASRMLWTKGVGEFVEAASALREAGVKARFVLAGRVDSGNPMAVPVDQLRKWNDSGKLEWWGQRDDMIAVFAQCHIVCLPTTYGEGVPKVLIEAAACGRPIVATDVPGCREIVRHDDNGLLVPAKDGRALAGALGRLIMDPALRERMGRRGREIAVQEFSLERVVTETLAVYRMLLPRAARQTTSGTAHPTNISRVTENLHSDNAKMHRSEKT